MRRNHSCERWRYVLLSAAVGIIGCSSACQSGVAFQPAFDQALFAGKLFEFLVVCVFEFESKTCIRNVTAWIHKRDALVPNPLVSSDGVHFVLHGLISPGHRLHSYRSSAGFLPRLHATAKTSGPRHRFTRTGLHAAASLSAPGAPGLSPVVTLKIALGTISPQAPPGVVECDVQTVLHS